MTAAARRRAQANRALDGSAWGAPPHPLPAVPWGCPENGFQFPGCRWGRAEPQGQGTGAGSGFGGVWA